MKTKELFAFIKERESIRIKKEAGKPKPWTQDPILQQYSFCNVRREDDKVTRWIKEYWRDAYAGDLNLWFLMTVARLVNWPDTLQMLTGPLIDLDGTVSWNAKRFVAAMHKRKAAGEKVFSGAYIVSTNGHKQDKAEYLAEHVLTPLWNSRKLFSKNAPTLAYLYEQLVRFNGLGSFMAAQIVADVKYTPRYSGTRDFWSFAASGPGSRRGLNRVMERPVDASWPGQTWLVALTKLSIEIGLLVKKAKMAPLHNQDLQNCLCEWDKYERTRLGEGRPRTTYPGV